MGFGEINDVSRTEKIASVRDLCSGNPIGKVVDVVSKINTGAKYDSKACQKSVGLNGVGTKAVNALSEFFRVISTREGKQKIAEFEKGILVKDSKEIKTSEDNGTQIDFTPDEKVFKNFKYHTEFLENQF